MSFASSPFCAGGPEGGESSQQLFGEVGENRRRVHRSHSGAYLARRCVAGYRSAGLSSLRDTAFGRFAGTGGQCCVRCSTPGTSGFRRCRCHPHVGNERTDHRANRWGRRRRRMPSRIVPLAHAKLVQHSRRRNGWRLGSLPGALGRDHSNCREKEDVSSTAGRNHCLGLAQDEHRVNSEAGPGASICPSSFPADSSTNRLSASSRAFAVAVLMLLTQRNGASASPPLARCPTSFGLLPRWRTTQSRSTQRAIPC